MKKMAAEADELETWQELLPTNPLFAKLKPCAHTFGRRNLLCEIRGDLFFWNSQDTTILTTNLKRIVAFPYKELVFQELKFHRPPSSDVVRMLADSSGQYIALQCERGLTVITLPRHRGQNGEFGGGTRSVGCSAVAVAQDFFLIHQDSKASPLVQVCWHPSAPFHIALLTMDSTLRLYSLADPEVEVLSIALSSSPTAGVLSMKDPVVGFALWEESAFLLQEDSVVTLSPLKHHFEPQPPLLMHPQVDNYDCDNYASSILVLDTNPCVLVIATSSGLLSHCVYLTDTFHEGVSGSSKQSLFIVESVSFDAGDSSNFPFSLLNNPVYSHIYYVVHSEGVHQVTLPWLTELQQYTNSEIETQPSLHPLPEDKESRVRLLVECEPGVNWLEGAVIVSEPMLGLTLVGLTSDNECITVSLERPTATPTLSAPSPGRPAPESHHPDEGFVKVIRDILENGAHRTVPRADIKETSQEECYRYLTKEIARLREQCILKHERAKEEMKHKILALEKLKCWIISERVRILDSVQEIATNNDSLVMKFNELDEKNKALERRLNEILCKVETQSPILSQAEEWMRDEVEGINSHLPVMRQKLIEARNKEEVVHGPANTPNLKITVTHSKTILQTLTDSGKSIKKLMLTIEELKTATALSGPT